jgi:hypothetical protein
MAATDPGRRPSAREASERLAALARPDGPSGPTTRRAPPPVAAAPAAEKPPAATTPRAPVRATTGRADRRRGLAQLTTGVGAVLTVVGAVGLGVVVLGGDDPATTGTTTASVPAGAAGTAAPDGSTAVATTVPDEPPAETAPATPEVLPLVSGPSAVCPYAMPQGWSVVAVDRPTGGQLRTVTRSPDGAASITCDATVPSGAEARATAAAARRARGPLQAFEEERFGPRDGAGSAWVWEYRHRQAGRPVRVLRVFLSGGDALGLEAAETAFEGLRPTFTAVVTRYEQGA